MNEDVITVAIAVFAVVVMLAIFVINGSGTKKTNDDINSDAKPPRNGDSRDGTQEQ